MQRTAALGRSQIMSLTMENCPYTAVHPVGKRIESELAGTSPRRHQVAAEPEETITSNKNLGSPGTDDPKMFLATVVRAVGPSSDYCY
jgi:hypothetical protein